MEAKQNIIILGDSERSRISILNMLSAFVSSAYKKVIVEKRIGRVSCSALNSTIATYAPGYTSVTAKNQISNSINSNPDFFVYDELYGNEANDLFSVANREISFLTTLSGEDSGYGIIKRLISAPFDVSIRDISALDLVIKIGKTQQNEYELLQLSEHRWLSKAEIEKGIIVGGKDMLEVKDMLNSFSIKRSELSRSKIISAYSKKYEISEKDSIREFDRRTQLLAEASCREECDVENEVNMYKGW